MMVLTLAFVLDEEFFNRSPKLAPQRRSHRLMGGHMQHTNDAAATALYDGSFNNVGLENEAGDDVMAQWLQSAGLQHLGSHVASTRVDQRHLPNLLMHGYVAQTAEEKQRLFKLMRSLNLNGESASEPYTPTCQTSAAMSSSYGFYSPDFICDFGVGLLIDHTKCCFFLQLLLGDSGLR